MNYPIPPTIPPSGQFSSLAVDQPLGKVVSNGYVTGKGSIETINGATVTYTPAQICNGLIVRTNGNGTDTLPSASAIAEELGLPSAPGSYIRYFSIYNNNGSNINLSGDGWSFTGLGTVYGYWVLTFAISIEYTSEWNITALCIGNVNLD